MAMIGDGRFLRPKRQEDKGGERFQAILKKGVRVSFCVLLLSFLLWMGHQTYVYILEDPFFQVREVEVDGYRSLKKETLLSLAPMDEMSNIFTVSLKGVAKRMESHPWIQDVMVRKVFPNKISIRIKERRPLAILQLEKLYYIDTQGVIFSPADDRDGYNYPMLTGLTRLALDREPAESKRLITKALELLNLVEKEKVPPLTDISEIHMEKSFGICCFTQGEGLEVRMGWEDFGEKLRRLSIIWSDLRKKGRAAVSIDCSDLKRMVVKKISGRR
jgi:cell division protein FtsQ